MQVQQLSPGRFAASVRVGTHTLYTREHVTARSAALAAKNLLSSDCPCVPRAFNRHGRAVRTLRNAF